MRDYQLILACFIGATGSKVQSRPIKQRVELHVTVYAGGEVLAVDMSQPSD
jgi:hypothetical protein